MFWPNLITILLLLVLGGIFWGLSRRAYWRLAWREITSRRLAAVSGVILALYLLVAVLDSVGWRSPLIDAATGEPRRSPQTGEIVYAPPLTLLDRLLTPLRTRKEFSYSAPLATHQYGSQNENGESGVQRVHPPLAHPRSHLFGTDRIGNDVLYLAIKSIRTGIIIGLLTTLVAIPFALLAGISAGYFGGWLDDIIQYIYTVLSAIPTVLFIAAFIVIFGAGLPQLCVAMGLSSWTGMCRLLRAETMKLRESDFVAAARALGQPAWRILLRHILPNVLHVVIISTVLRFSTEVLAEAVLTYLGIGVGADTMSWGTMINDARSELTRSPLIWWKLTAAFTLMLGLVLPANFFGDAVRDALDPRLRTQ